MNNRVIVIDGGAVQFRAIFSYRNNPRIPCTYTFMSMLIGYLKRLNVTTDDLLILAQDYGSWRKNIDKTYKAQRQDFRESFEEKEWWETRYKEFNELYKKIDESLPMHLIKIYMREADDIISTSCRYYKDKEVIIISSDKDLEQLCIFSNTKIFSPISKKFKEITNPMGILLSKINKDISDNLLEAPSTEAEFEKRKLIVDLTSLPLEIEQPIKEQLDKLMPKNLYIHKVPFNKVREEVKKLYKL